MGAGGWAGPSLPTRSSAQAVWPGPAKGTTEPGPQDALEPWLMGPTGTSALPQRLQLVGHLLQLPLNGQQALKLLVLGENSKSAGARSTEQAASEAGCATDELCGLGQMVLLL